MRFLIGLVLAHSALAQDPPAGMKQPQYNEKGELVRPRDFEQWTFVGSSMGLSYATDTPARQPGLIHNVHMQPEAFRAYKETGKVPEKTIMILTLYNPEQKVSPNLHGHFQGDLVATEVAVKDSARFKEGWAYFDFGGGAGLRESASAQPQERCHACHAKHAAKDNIFMQFYPALRK